MPSTTQINEYDVFYSANAFTPCIGLLSAGKRIGQLNFSPNAAKLPADGIKDGVAHVFYRQQDFANVIDLLRNEKPVYFYYNGSGSGFENGIRTFAEPVGENEPAAKQAPKTITPAAVVAAPPRRAR